MTITFREGSTVGTYLTRMTKGDKTPSQIVVGGARVGFKEALRLKKDIKCVYPEGIAIVSPSHRCVELTGDFPVNFLTALRAPLTEMERIHARKKGT